MHIGLVTRDLGPGGGTAGYAHGLAGWLIARGDRVTAFVAAAHAVPDGVEVVRCHARTRGAAGRRRFADWVRSQDSSSCDLLHGLDPVPDCHVYRAGGGAHGAWLRCRHGAMGAALVMRLRPRERWALAVEAEAVSQAHIVVCNSVSAARDLRAWYPDARPRVVRNGVDTARFRPDAGDRDELRQEWGVPADGRVVLFLGHGFRRKGLDIAVRAFERTCSSQDRMVIAGADRRSGAWRAWATRHLGARLLWLGERPDPERLLRAADAVVLPTRYDAASNTTLEALASGVPPVTTTCDGSAEVLPCPALVASDPYDELDVARALDVALTGGDQLRERCIRVAQAWPVSRNGEAMRRLYEECRDG